MKHNYLVTYVWKPDESHTVISHVVANRYKKIKGLEQIDSLCDDLRKREGIEGAITILSLTKL